MLRNAGKLIAIFFCALVLTFFAVKALAEVKITQQPKDAYALLGKKAAVTVEAQGEALTYQWYYKNAAAKKFAKAKFTTPTYSAKITAAVSGRQVYCVVTDKDGSSVKSKTVTLKAAEDLLITGQPKDQTVTEGQKATLTVKAQGSGLTYRWWVKNPGAKAFKKTTGQKAAYSVKMTASLSGRQMYCVITDAVGRTVRTDTVTLKAVPELKITRQPENAVVPKGTKATVTVAASGEGLKYQWYYKNASGKKFAKAKFTTPTYTARVTAAVSGRQIYCVVTDASGKTLQSDTVTLKALPALTIPRQPQNVYTQAGKKVTLALEAQGEGLAYRWWVKNPGAKVFKKTTGQKAAFSVKVTEAMNGRQMYCVVTDQYGQTVQSDTVTLTLVPELKILAQPRDTEAEAGEEAAVTVTAQGEGLQYQWYYKNVADKSFAEADAVGSTYAVKMTAAADGRKVYCVVTDRYGQRVQSATATLTLPAPDLDQLTWEIASGGRYVTITGYTDKAGSLTIPEEINGLPVKNIAEGAFEGCASLKSVAIPGSVRTVSAWAFEGCTGLTRVILKNGVEIIDKSAFESCTSLEAVDLPDTLAEIGENAFYACASLTHVTLPDQVTKMWKGAFRECSSLRSIRMPKGLTFLGPYSFYECVSLESISIPSGVKKICESTFQGCVSLASVTLPQGLTDIEVWAFLECEKLTGLVLPNGLTTIGEGAFIRCRNITSLILPNTMKTIETKAFGNCFGLETILIPASVTSIAQDAFISSNGGMVCQVAENSYAHEWCRQNGAAFELI